MIDVGLVAEAEDEVLVPEVGVVLHQVPEDRPVADLDHRLGDLARVLAQARARARRRTGRPSCLVLLSFAAMRSRRTSSHLLERRAASCTTANGRPDRSATSSVVCCAVGQVHHPEQRRLERRLLGPAAERAVEAPPAELGLALGVEADRAWRRPRARRGSSRQCRASRPARRDRSRRGRRPRCGAGRSGRGPSG